LSRQKPEAGAASSPATLIRRQALDLLARREHAVRELRQKLQRKGHDTLQIDEVLAALSRAGLQSEQRFTECFVHSRKNRGEGPLRIRAALQQRGISDELIVACLDEAAGDWSAMAQAVRQKRFGAGWPQDHRERARQARFLQQRGFTMEQISRLLFRD